MVECYRTDGFFARQNALFPTKTKTTLFLRKIFLAIYAAESFFDAQSLAGAHHMPWESGSQELIASLPGLGCGKFHSLRQGSFISHCSSKISSQCKHSGQWKFFPPPSIELNPFFAFSTIAECATRPPTRLERRLTVVKDAAANYFCSQRNTS